MRTTIIAVALALLSAPATADDGTLCLIAAGQRLPVVPGMTIDSAEVAPIADDTFVTAGHAAEVDRVFAGAWRIADALRPRLIVVTLDYAIATGASPRAAAEELARLFSSPRQGARTLDERMRILTYQQARAIDEADGRGDGAIAQGILLDALAKRVQGSLQRFRSLITTYAGTIGVSMVARKVTFDLRCAVNNGRVDERFLSVTLR